MARKRGGLAGVWDRNKKIIKPIVTVGAGLVGGPWGAAAANAAMEGFDRPGKSGVGFDWKKGAVGAATGYGLGQTAQWAKGAIAAKTGAGAVGAAGAKAPATVSQLEKVNSAVTASTPIASQATQAGGKMAGFDWTAAANIGAGIINGVTGSAAAKRQQQTAREQMQLERDKTALSDRQFAAKYGFDKAQAETDLAKWNRTQGNSEQTQALAIQNQLNRAPLMDKAQAMLLARLGAVPTGFQGRDITRGTAELGRQVTGPMDGVRGRMADAAASYRMGDGGMDFDLHRRLIAKLSNPTATRMSNPGTYSPGQGYVPSAYENTNSPGTLRPPVPEGGGGTTGTPRPPEDDEYEDDPMNPRRTWGERPTTTRIY